MLSKYLYSVNANHTDNESLKGYSTIHNNQKLFLVTKKNNLTFSFNLDLNKFQFCS